jgi:RNA polymerase sigma-70 factor (ECF subfamily)
MIESHGTPVTQLLRSWRDGDREALNALLPVIYGQLRRMANSALQAEPQSHTLSATALVHEAYLRLAGAQVHWQDRTHFLAVAARVMRRVLVDYAKSRHRQKRGGSQLRVSFEDGLLASHALSERVSDLDHALGVLEEFDARKAQIIEMLYFGGANHDETAEVLGISRATVQREARLAKVWLYNQLHGSSTLATHPSAV